MSIDNIGNRHGIRLLLNGKPLTRRIKVAHLSQQGLSPKEYIEQQMQSFTLINCTVEVSSTNGSSFTNPFTFEYSLQPTQELHNPTEELETGIPLSGHFKGFTYVGYEGLLAKQYEKWYNEETDKCRSLRNELNDTHRELSKLKIEYQLLEQRVELDYSLKELERERVAKTGLNGIMETIERNTFLHGLLEKVVDNLTQPKDKGALSGLPIGNLNDPELQQILPAVISGLTKLVETDREQFGYATLVLDKFFTNETKPQHVYAMINTPPQPPKQLPLRPIDVL